MRVGEALSVASTLARGGLDAVRDQRAGRRVWARDGRAYVEARGLQHVDATPAYVETLERRLADEDGVRWAAVNGVLGDVIVDYEPAVIGVDRLRRVVERSSASTEWPTGRATDRFIPATSSRSSTASWSSAGICWPRR